MRDYAKISPQFWIQGSGRRLRGEPLAQLVALYLMSCPAASMVGIYYLPLPTICHETSITLQQVRDALATCERAGIAYYDEEAEIAWVPNLARYQIGETLHAKDEAKRKGVINAIRPFERHRFYRMFLQQYAAAYNLGIPVPEADPGGPQVAPTRGPAGPLYTRAPAPDPVVEDDETPPPAASGPLPDGVVAVERTFWIESYRSGVAAGGGPSAYVFPDVKFKALRGVVEAHCTGDDRKNVPSWIQARVARFVRSRRNTGWPPNTVDPYHPDALLAWHNSEDFAREERARSGPRLKVAKPAAAAPEAPPLSAEEIQENAARLKNLIRGLG